MAQINFLYPKASEVKYKIHTFPDGHEHLEICSELNHREPLTVTIRIATTDDLFILLQLKDICDRHSIKIEQVYITYLMCARMDRLMSFNEAVDLKIIFDTLVTAFPKTSFVIFEPHNTNSLLQFGSFLFDDDTFTDYPGVMPDNIGCILLPDNGAFKRYYHLRFIKDVPFLYASKQRTHNRIQITLPEIDIPDDKDILVLDDLCDGGGTFFALHQNLPEKYKNRVHLVVAHAIQMQAIIDLASIYKTITFTNSYTAWENAVLPDNVKIIQLWDPKNE